ncbi:MAG TPA: polysaccharide deacetylase family protein [Bacillota bacterium]
MPRPSTDFWREALKSSSGGRGLAGAGRRGTAFGRAIAAFLVVAVAIAVFLGSGLVLRSLDGAGAPEPEPPRHVVVLVYHHLAPADQIINPHNTVSPERFEEQLTWFKGHGYETIALADLYAYLSGTTRAEAAPKVPGRSPLARILSVLAPSQARIIKGRAPGQLPAKPLVITFDDGYESNYVYAYPILKRHGFHASIGLIGRVVRDGPAGPFDPGVLTYLTWDEVREMAKDGTIDFQSHTYDLHQLAPDGTPATLSRPREAVLTDLVGVKGLIEMETGQPVLALAYPYGRHTPELDALAAEAGYKLGLTIDEGFERPGDDRFKVKRFILSMDDTPERLAARFPDAGP